MTIISIPTTEKPIYAEICQIFDLEVTFYTRENNPEMLTMEVDTDNCNIMHSLGRCVEIKSQMINALK